MVTVGVTVYPAPAFVINISLIECTPFTDVVIATAVASIPPSGAESIETVGTFV